MSAGQYVNEETLCYLCKLPDASIGQLFTVVQTYLNPMRNNPVVAQLTLQGSQHKEDVSLEQLFVNADMENTAEVTTLSNIISRYIFVYLNVPLTFDTSVRN